MMEANTSPQKKMYSSIKWWIGSVILAFFPIIVSFIIQHSKTGGIDFIRLIGDAELILSAFGVSAPMLVSHLDKLKEDSSQIFYLLIVLVSFCQLIAYTTFKTSDDNITHVVYTISGACVVMSVGLAWALNRKTLEG